MVLQPSSKDDKTEIWLCDVCTDDVQPASCYCSDCNKKMCEKHQKVRFYCHWYLCQHDKLSVCQSGSSLRSSVKIILENLLNGKVTTLKFQPDTRINGRPINFKKRGKVSECMPSRLCITGCCYKLTVTVN